MCQPFSEHMCFRLNSICSGLNYIILNSTSSPGTLNGTLISLSVIATIIPILKKGLAPVLLAMPVNY